MLFCIAKTLLGNPEIDMARYWKENSLSFPFEYKANDLNVPQYCRNIQTSFEAWFFYTNFSLLKIKFDEWGSKKGLLVCKDSN